MLQFFEKIKDSVYKKWSEYLVTLSVVVLITLAFLYSKPAPATITAAPDAIEEHTPVPTRPVLNDHDQRQLRCMAENAYFEAGNQSRRGMIAVSNVVMNRVRDGRFPKTPCGVIYQRSGRSCQFSWVCFGKKRINDRMMFQLARETAEDVYYGRVNDNTLGSKFYHAVYVNPGWGYRRSITIGSHIFYRG